MAHENIRFPKPHMAIRDDFFFYFDERNDTLNVKVCDGGTAFIYPLESSLGSNPVKAMEFDGHFFWTMQQGTTVNDSIIKKWQIENYVCKLVDTLDLSETVDDIFQCSTFALEFYNSKLATTLPSHSTSIELTNYYDKVEPGTVLTLGPNEEGLYENVTVTGTLDSPNKFGLDFYTFNSFEVDTAIYFPTNVWLVNNYTHTDFGGSLYKYSLINDRIDDVFEDEDYEYVNACCFYNYNSNQYILSVVGTVLRFFNIVNEVNETSMILDNRRPDNEEIPVYDIKLEGTTLYRLQTQANYYGTNYSWTTYNYQVSTIRPFVDSVTIDVTPKILPSNGINVAEITVSVRDQYDDPIQLSPVFLSDSDLTGFITLPEVYTNLFGVATSYYKAGTVPNSVTLSAMATQYD